MQTKDEVVQEVIAWLTQQGYVAEKPYPIWDTLSLIKTKKLNIIKDIPDCVFLVKRAWLRDYFINGTAIGQIKLPVNMDIQKFKNEVRDATSDTKLKNTFLEQQNQILRTENVRLIKDAGADKHIVDLFESAVKKIDYTNKWILFREYSDKKVDEDMIALLSDIHFGERVDAESMMGSNEYDINIARDRLNLWANNILTIKDNFKNGYNHRKLHIFGLGDWVSGNIHEELMNGTAEVDQVLVLAEIMSQILEMFSHEFEEVDFDGIIGNHGRFTKKPHYKKKYNNFDYLVYQYMATRCSNLKNITFNIPKSGMLIKTIRNHNYLLRHGDCKANGYAGIPHYGISRADSKLTQMFAYLQSIYINYHCMGHFHTTNEIEKVGGAIVMNGSVKGGDEMALEALHTTTKPSQVLMGCHNKFGKTWSMDVVCE